MVFFNFYLKFQATYSDPDQMSALFVYVPQKDARLKWVMVSRTFVFVRMIQKYNVKINNLFWRKISSISFLLV